MGIDINPTACLLAFGESCAAVPVVGKRIEPIVSLSAMALWGLRVAPEMLSYLVQNRLPSGEPKPRREDLEPAHEVSAAALRGLVSPQRLNIDWPAPDRLPPVVRHARSRQQYLHRSSVSYGPAPGQLLEIWRREDLPAQPAPVVVFVPGGGWVHGKRMLQGYALMSHLAEQGWICLSIDYRVSPQHRWPRHVADVKAAVAWARANIAEFGGNPDFVAVAGCSAGGHLAALAGLTHDDSDFHDELPAGADTTVDAVVGIYGRYDWVDRSTPERDRFVEFLENVVIRKRQAEHPHIFHNASPITRVRPDAPPFLVVHGSDDTVIPVAQARDFVGSLRAVSRSPVGYLEVPGAQHGFDLADGACTASVVTAIRLFLDEVHDNAVTSRAGDYQIAKGM
ncbi:alpha/beta hydrolase [Mycobacterium sp. Y57]|uniref:alpha/beta hydrolase n=1 Tax=Mycolicibacterium xanthum TaxID=2796469 RepID=UPI001C85FFEC|nr:alpha/beta hydrolase [Mycolicibacterium xanthum]MBX7432631.1 alpha/beta hydrolase [Mycolicibacterium xanthum]